MCSTCNFTKYLKDTKVVRGETIEYLKVDPEHCAINMNCDIEGKKFKIDDFVIYRCPTCGRKLF